ncbi:MAG TPA: hypothetical protein VFE27_06905 [Acidobacteriaceae bacterium]|jgi:hypothetical protein|nr:hypothetical protein [Acidobacteriaceae bacterium]
MKMSFWPLWGISSSSIGLKERTQVADGVYFMLMVSWRLNQRARPSLWVALGFLCCALIVCTAIVQVGHTHADGRAVQTDCALCHTAHVVVQPIISRYLPHTVYVVAAVPALLQRIRPKLFSVFSLFNRPPPVDIAFA